MLNNADIKRLKENYGCVCAYCRSLNWEPVGDLDYLKKCNDCGKVFSTYPKHN